MKQKRNAAQLQLELDLGPTIIGAQRHIKTTREFWQEQIKNQPDLSFSVGMGCRMSKGYEFDATTEMAGRPKATITEALLDCAERASPAYAAHIRNFCHWLDGREARTELTEVAVGVQISRCADGWCAAPNRTIVRK